MKEQEARELIELVLNMTNEQAREFRYRLEHTETDPIYATQNEKSVL